MPFTPMTFGTQGTARPKGKCGECGRQIATVPNGRLNTHNTDGHRCPGSGTMPQQGRG
jgi:DNA-directed RNA polymerase subunit RPC12/RpoP